MPLKKINREWVLLGICLIAGFFLRVHFSRMGENNRDVLKMMGWVESIDSCNPFYCRDKAGQVLVPLYGTHSFQIIRLVAGVTSWFGPLTPANFHLGLAVFLSLFDLLAAVLLWRMVGVVAGLVMLFSPASILITGYHSQVDACPIALGFLSMVLYTKGKENWSAFTLILSLAFKHTLFFLPLWIFLAPTAGKLSRRFRFSAIVYLGFALLFVPMLFEGGGLAFQNLKSNWSEWTISGYGLSGSSVLLELHKIALPPALLPRLLHKPTPEVLKLSFNVFIVVAGFLLGRRYKLPTLFFLFLVTQVALTPRLAIQYLAIPTIAAAGLYRWRLIWVANILAGITVILSPKNIYALEDVQRRLSKFYGYFGSPPFEVAQFWYFLVLVVAVASLWTSPKKEKSVWDEIRSLFAKGRHAER